MRSCTKCVGGGLAFSRPYWPEEFIEGNPKSQIWIIGLNPKEEPPPFSVSELVYCLDNEAARHSYFSDFGKLSASLRLHSEGNAAHTDLVKCHSRSWLKKPAQKRQIIANCRVYLENQLKRYMPRLIICNGADVAKMMIEIVPPKKPLGPFQTQYVADFQDATVGVILSGFVGRLDGYAKARLGREIEQAMDELSLPSPR